MNYLGRVSSLYFLKTNVLIIKVDYCSNFSTSNSLFEFGKAIKIELMGIQLQYDGRMDDI